MSRLSPQVLLSCCFWKEAYTFICAGGSWLRWKFTEYSEFFFQVTSSLRLVSSMLILWLDSSGVKKARSESSGNLIFLFCGKPWKPQWYGNCRFSFKVLMTDEKRCAWSVLLTLWLLSCFCWLVLLRTIAAGLLCSSLRCPSGHPGMPWLLGVPRQQLPWEPLAAPAVPYLTLWGGRGAKSWSGYSIAQEDRFLTEGREDISLLLRPWG